MHYRCSTPQGPASSSLLLMRLARKYADTIVHTISANETETYTQTSLLTVMAEAWPSAWALYWTRSVLKNDW